MKHPIFSLLALLLAVPLLGACSQESAIITFEEPPAELEQTDTIDGTGAAQTDQEDADSAESDSAELDLVVALEVADDADKDDEPDTEGVEQNNVKLEVSNQKSFGQITVKKVATARDGWVSVHRSKEDGSIVLPEGIGEARVDSGDSEGIVIDLWEAPFVGEKLWVLLHIDAGERGRYEFPEKDFPVRRNGEMMARSLIVQGEEDNEAE
ncbi:MAG: hypothetical protein AAF703_17090 [Cyanobacteria bacterium P01_D01_bin.105]